MRLRNLTLMLAGGFGTVALVSTAVTVVTLLDNQQLRREALEARREGNHALTENRRLQDEREDLAARDEQLRKLESELATLQAGASTNASPAPARVAPVRARMYLGQQYVGLAWIVPGAAIKDSETGQIGYEPAVLMDESVRNAVGVSKTNVVEREVVRPTTVNYNYAYPYQVWWPTYWVAPANGNNGRPPKPPRLPPPAHRAPQEGQPFLSTKFYQPPEKPFMPSQPPFTGAASGNASMGRSGPAPMPGLNANRVGTLLLPRPN